MDKKNNQGQAEEIQDESVLEQVSGGATFSLANLTLISRTALLGGGGVMALQSGHDNPTARIPSIARFIR